MKICSIYSDVSDKIKGVIFAKKIAEAEAEAAAARKKTIFIVCLCAGIALVAAAAAVGVYFLAKNETVKEKVGAAKAKVVEAKDKAVAKVGEIVETVKSKMPCKKNAECECVDEAVEDAE